MRAITDRPHWSYSALAQHLRCPLQFFFERVVGLPRLSASDAQVLGSSIHAALARYHRALQAGEPIRAHEVHEALLASWDEQASRMQVVHNRRSRANNLALGAALVDLYLREPPPTDIVAVEAPLLAPITTSAGLVLEKPLLVVPDLITCRDDGTPNIVEIKSASRAFSESEVATSLQPSCYASALHELTGNGPFSPGALSLRVDRRHRIDRGRFRLSGPSEASVDHSEACRHLGSRTPRAAGEYGLSDRRTGAPRARMKGVATRRARNRTPAWEVASGNRDAGHGI